MDCHCCVAGKGQWREEYKEMLCQECFEVLEQMKKVRKKASDKSKAKSNKPIQPTAKDGG